MAEIRVEPLSTSDADLRIFPAAKPDLAIELGTANMRIAVAEKGVSTTLRCAAIRRADYVVRRQGGLPLIDRPETFSVRHPRPGASQDIDATSDFGPRPRVGVRKAAEIASRRTDSIPRCDQAEARLAQRGAERGPRG